MEIFEESWIVVQESWTCSDGSDDHDLPLVFLKIKLLIKATINVYFMDSYAG